MNEDKKHLPILPGHVGYSPDYKAVPPRASPEHPFGPIANPDGSLPPRPSKAAAARDRQRRIDHYAKNYSKQTLAELIISLEDKLGIPSAID